MMVKRKSFTKYIAGTERLASAIGNGDLADVGHPIVDGDVLLPNEAEATEMELINMSGQVVATKTFSGKGSWMEMGDLPKGMYMLRIRNAEVCLTRKVLRE